MIGGGTVALRRVRSLLRAQANVIVIAPEVLPELAGLPVAVLRRPYREGDLAAAWLAHAATDDPAVNSLVAAEAERSRIWCVRADDAIGSAAWTPAVTRHGDLTVAVTAGGDPGRSQRLRAAIALALAEGSLPVRKRSSPDSAAAPPPGTAPSSSQPATDRAGPADSAVAGPAPGPWR